MAGYENPRGAASKPRSVGTRMGQPGSGNTGSSRAEHIGPRRRTRGSETSQYPEEKKSTEIPQVAASERGRAQTQPSDNSLKKPFKPFKPFQSFQRLKRLEPFFIGTVGTFFSFLSCNLKAGGCRTARVPMSIYSQRRLERHTIGGESPVGEIGRLGKRDPE